ncbi:M23 family metallopeptidase [Kitasatospora sp. McL0602]|uniref:M23 family metallopeptidase n=1 Tax=Kitasatospora sp. McL0602 TaxID=3439530 RepID=UPI003F89367D
MPSPHTARHRLTTATDSVTHSLLRPAAAWIRERRSVVACGGAATLAFGALLLPGFSASAQTVRPTTPGSSVFTSAPAAAAHAARTEPVGLVQVSAPTAYQLPGSASSQDAVTVAGNLAPSAPAPAPAATPAPEPAPAPAPAPAPSFYSPAPGALVSNPYGVANHEYAAGYHTGVDFAVDSGTPLRAVGAGTVVSAGWDGAYGREIVLRLADGHFAEYAHMSSLTVDAGESVTPGQEIGRSGTTGNSTGPHLHFEIRNANKYGSVVDPIAYLTERGATDF